MSYYNNDSQNREYDATHIHGQELYRPQSALPAAPTPPPSGRRRTVRGGGYRSMAMLLAMAIIAFAGGAGGAYLVVSTMEPDALVGTVESDSTGSSVTTQPMASNAGYSQGGVTDVVKKAANSVVEIYTETMQSSYFGRYITEGAGSGVVYSEDGYIITNNHVIEDASTIMVRLGDGSEYEAVLIGTDEQTDLAVLKINAKGLTPVSFADSDYIEVGQLAVVIGNPLGSLGGTVTEGIISAKDRELILEGQAMTLLQTSAAVNPGNSGGGIFDAEGNLVGIINAKSSGTTSGASIEGLGFAIPSNTVAKVAGDLIGSGYVTGRPQIGVSIREISDERTAAQFEFDRFGVLVLEVTANNNLQVGDLIIAVEGVDITTNDQLSAVLAKHEVGDVLTFTVLREGREVRVQVPLTEKVPEHIRQQIAEA